MAKKIAEFHGTPFPGETSIILACNEEKMDG